MESVANHYILSPFHIRMSILDQKIIKQDWSMTLFNTAPCYNR